MKEQTRRPRFLIVSPPQQNGGPIVLHLLCRMLDNLGYESRVFLLNNIPRSRMELLQSNLPFYNKNAKQSLHSQNGPVKGCLLTNWPYVDDDTIVVYPEIIFGNPLAAKHVVRWFLGPYSYKGVFIDSKPYDDDDLYICYREIFNNYQLNPTGRQVQLQHFNYELYKRWNYGHREGSCFIIRKGINRSDLPSTVPGPILDNLSDEEKVEIMNQCKYCYSYDTQTFYSIVAAICGCISIVVPEPGKNRDDYLCADEKGWGIAYGTSQKELNFAQSTMNELKQYIKSFNVHNEENVQMFLSYCQEYFQERMDTGISW